MSDRATSDEEWKQVEQRKPRTRRCSYCGSELHTLRDCPELLKRQQPQEEQK